jgi:hypothetical protein
MLLPPLDLALIGGIAVLIAMLLVVALLLVRWHKKKGAKRRIRTFSSFIFL